VNLGGVEEVVADKGYHSGPVLQAMQAASVLSLSTLDPSPGFGGFFSPVFWLAFPTPWQSFGGPLLI
jgi:hypothetical protein